MNEELYCTQLKNGGTFRCVKSQLMKSGGKCPIWGHVVFADMAEAHARMLEAKGATQ